mgnify:CR=1 FL=1
MTRALDPEVADAINASHENSLYLPGIALDASIRATTDHNTVAKADAVLLVCPAQTLRSVTMQLADNMPVYLHNFRTRLNNSLKARVSASNIINRKFKSVSSVGIEILKECLKIRDRRAFGDLQKHIFRSEISIFK